MAQSNTPTPTTLVRPPADFVCPLTKEVMDDPVIDPIFGGISFERTAIMKWLVDDGNTECPITGVPMSVDTLVPNAKLQWKIRYWKKKQQQQEQKSGLNPQEACCDDNETATDNVDQVINEDQQSKKDEEEDGRKSGNPPKRFLCPLTQKLMEEPMVSKYGHSYERLNILQWIAIHGGICPLTYKPLDISLLAPNVTLQREIELWNIEQETKTKNENNKEKNSNEENNKNTTTTSVKKEQDKKKNLTNFKINGNGSKVTSSSSMAIKQVMSKNFNMMIPTSITFNRNQQEQVEELDENRIVSLDSILDDVEDTLLEAENITLKL